MGKARPASRGFRRCAVKLSRCIPAWVFAWVLFLGCLSPVAAQELSGTTATSNANKENLDLPYDAAGTPEEDEDPPEIVTFYGQQMEGDGIFYVIDKSSTMHDEGELEIAKREVIRNIREFSARAQFAIVFFSDDVIKFPASGMPAEASPAMKAAAISFVQAVVYKIWTCPQQGLSQGLRFANMATSKRKVLIYVGDGGGTCQGADEATYLRQTLGCITSMNFQRVQINCIGVLNPTPLGVDFMKRLSAANGGTYTRITR